MKTARQRRKTLTFGKLYTCRAGIEATISLAVRAFGLRRTRYAGLAKTGLRHAVTAAALNLVRMIRRIAGEPIMTTRRSQFGSLLTGPVPT